MMRVTVATPRSDEVEEMLARVKAGNEQVERRLADLALAVRRFREAITTDQIDHTDHDTYRAARARP